MANRSRPSLESSDADADDDGFGGFTPAFFECLNIVSRNEGTFESEAAKSISGRLVYLLTTSKDFWVVQDTAHLPRSSSKNF